MVAVQALSARLSADRRRSQDAQDDQGRDVPSRGGVLVEQRPENMNITRQEVALKRIASLPLTRQDKVLDIRRRIAEGTYELGKRLDRAMDRMLEALAP